jgi:PAS domain S-box-containing protein
MAIALVKVSSEIHAALARSQLSLLDCDSVQSVEQHAVQAGEPLDALVIGGSVTDPVQWATRAYRIDPGLGVVILGADLQQCDRIRSALRFAPLIGSDVVCSESREQSALAAIEQSAARARARRTHQRTLRALQSQLAPSRVQAIPPRERYAAQLVEIAPVGIVVTDGERRVVSANAEAARILGVTEREILGVTLGSGHFGVDSTKLKELLASAASEPLPPMIIERKSEAGTSQLEARAVTIREESGTGYLVLFQDITKRIALEKQKDEALAVAEAASRLKDEFLATVSHELRTPLNAVLGWARLLRTQLAPEKRERALETIERNALVQSQLIEDLLDITRITTGKLRLEVERAELAPIIEAAIETVRPSIEAKQIRLTQTLDTRAGVISGDPQRLQQVVWNLLSNAVKFSPKGGHVRVLLERVDSHIAITVSDNGQGIPPEFLSAVFESFRQWDGSSTRRHAGLGLGLAITKHLVELHGGTIHAHSEGIGKGASFTVKLPVASVRLERPARPRLFDSQIEIEAPPELLNLRVLVLDDEQDARELVGNVLANCGAIVRLAADVDQALAELDAFSPNVIVSDIGMPGEDGYSFVTKLRARPRERGGVIPAAALTAYVRAEDRRRALQAGFEMHVGKPVDPSELVVVVAALARMAKLMQ